MIIFMQAGSSPEDDDRVREVATGLGCRLVEPDAVSGVIRLDDSGCPADMAAFRGLPGVAHVHPGTDRPLRVQRTTQGADTVVKVGSCSIGGGATTIIAGPCAVEDERQFLPLAHAVARAGADLLRGGAYKPRSSPYDFQGLGKRGLELLARARDETGLPVVTEAVDEASLEQVEAYADMVQIGARNMQNFELLKRAGRSRLPVFLKRGMSADLEDLLRAAEYVVESGNPNVVLCERGIRTFSRHSRFTLDLSIVPQIKQRCHLPIVVDPSHASGLRASVGPLARAALAAGADGVMVEVHPCPERALSDGPQSLRVEEFESLAADLRAMAAFLAQQREAVR